MPVSGDGPACCESGNVDSGHAKPEHCLGSVEQGLAMTPALLPSRREDTEVSRLVEKTRAVVPGYRELALD